MANILVTKTNGGRIGRYYNLKGVVIASEDPTDEDNVTIQVAGGGIAYNGIPYSRFINGETSQAFASRILLLEYIQNNFFVDASGGGGGSQNLQQVTDIGNVTTRTMRHAAASSSADSATLGQAQTVARAPFIIAVIPTAAQIPPDYAITWQGTADEGLPFAPVSGNSGKSLFFFNDSPIFTATLTPTDSGSGGRFWDTDNAAIISFVIPPKTWVEFFNSSLYWIVKAKTS